MTTKQLQHLLAYLGYSLTPDGLDGPETKATVTQFQQDYGGLSIDGIPGDHTQAALRNAVGDDWQKPAANGSFWDEIQYFTREEFRYQCGGKYCNGFPVEPAEATVRALDEIRRRLGVPVTISSGVRCVSHNADIGGVRNSQHLYGLAADLHSSARPKEMQQVAESVLGDTGGIGRYSWGIHIDTRATKARWLG